MMKFLKKRWHMICFVGSIILAFIVEKHWASLLVFLVAFGVYGRVERDKIRKKESEKYLKIKKINHLKPHYTIIV